MKSDFTFCHAADLHLGSRFWGISQKDPELGRRLYESTFESFSRIIDVAKERADFMVIAGDMFDEAVMTVKTKKRFCTEAERFGKPIYAVKGNHDFKDSWKDSVPFPPNVHILDDTPQSLEIEVRGHTVEIVGQSYPTRHTSENIASNLRGNPMMFSIGLLHCSVEEIADSAEYAPCSIGDMLGKDIDYWALGHIHRRQVIRDSNPAIVYPGNIQGRNPKEIGEKGCYIVSVAGKDAEKTFVPTQSIVWNDVRADITGLTTVDELVERVKEMSAPRSILSIEYIGRGNLDKAVKSDPEGIAEMIASATGCETSVSTVNTCPDIDLDAARNGETLISEIIRSADRFRTMDPEKLLSILTESGPAKDVVPYLKYFAKSGRLNELVEEAELSVIYRISGGSE